ncbi:hypothetical protein UFOVP1_25 [uncultured Caudovirales phage]|uniref:Uncharacterized protein n=1 Tax=uncultured Caudovirales phage TaxID=2100421 RepID=A0A6J5KHD4_9CAUD|nr:hypothetical protein UFOVP1_25 [uncultured Caudovirales phage]
MNALVAKHPIISFMVVYKLFWTASFFFTIYVIQGQVPSLRQWILGAIWTIVTLPLNYWLTYSFGVKYPNNK